MQIRSEFHRPLDPARRQFIVFANTAIYSPVPYLPQVIMVSIGRIFSAPPIAQMYLGRIGNAFAYAILGWLTLRILPILKWPACLILLSPLPIFLSGSLSADPMTTSLAFLATASVLRLILDSQPASTCLLAILCVSLIGTALCKWTYFTIPLLLLAVPWQAWGKSRISRLIPFCVLACGLIAFAIWSDLSDPMHVPLRNGDPAAQLHWIQSHPLPYLRAIAATAKSQAPTLVWSSIGILGQLDTKLAPWFVGGYLLLIVWATINDHGEIAIGRSTRILTATAVIISSGLIVTCEYLVWNIPGNPIIEGIQGRYFIPIALMLMIAIRRTSRVPIQPAVLQFIILASCTYTSIAVLVRYF